MKKQLQKWKEKFTSKHKIYHIHTVPIEIPVETSASTEMVTEEQSINNNNSPSTTTDLGVFFLNGTYRDGDGEILSYLNLGELLKLREVSKYAKKTIEFFLPFKVHQVKSFDEFCSRTQALPSDLVKAVIYDGMTLDKAEKTFFDFYTINIENITFSHDFSVTVQFDLKPNHQKHVNYYVISHQSLEPYGFEYSHLDNYPPIHTFTFNPLTLKPDFTFEDFSQLRINGIAESPGTTWMSFNRRSLISRSQRLSDVCQLDKEAFAAMKNARAQLFANTDVELNKDSVIPTRTPSPSH